MIDDNSKDYWHLFIIIFFFLLHVLLLLFFDYCLCFVVLILFVVVWFTPINLFENTQQGAKKYTNTHTIQKIKNIECILFILKGSV